jgi:hypothetical protein
LDDRDHRPPGLPRLDTGPIRIIGKGSGEPKRKPWDARQWLKDHALGPSRGAPRKQGNGGAMTTITVQAVVCGLVIVAVLVLKAVNVPQTQEVLSGLDQALTTDTALDRALGKLKFVGDFFSGSQAVFNPETEGFVPPVKDMAVETGGSPSYVISVEVGGVTAPVLAAADGQVFYSGTSSDYGTLVIIRHQNGYETWYGGLASEVKAGHTVLAGERIGTVTDATFKFLAFSDGEPMDPRPYMRTGGD